MEITPPSRRKIEDRSLNCAHRCTYTGSARLHIQTLSDEDENKTTGAAETKRKQKTPPRRRGQSSALHTNKNCNQSCNIVLPRLEQAGAGQGAEHERTPRPPTPFFSFLPFHGSSVYLARRIRIEAIMAGTGPSDFTRGPGLPAPALQHIENTHGAPAFLHLSAQPKTNHTKLDRRSVVAVGFHGSATYLYHPKKHKNPNKARAPRRKKTKNHPTYFVHSFFLLV